MRFIPAYAGNITFVNEKDESYQKWVNWYNSHLITMYRIIKDGYGGHLPTWTDFCYNAYINAAKNQKIKDRWVRPLLETPLTPKIQEEPYDIKRG